MKQYRIHKNDLVEVLSGSNKGKKGTVLKILRKKDRVLIEGVNMHIHHIRPNPQLQQAGGRIEKEVPLHISNVAVVCPHCSKATRIGYKYEEGTSKDGIAQSNKVRFCKKCNAIIGQGGKK